MNIKLDTYFYEMVLFKLNTKTLNLIKNKDEHKNYNLSNCDAVFPIKLILWGPSKSGIDLNMETFRNNLRLEGTEKYTAHNKSGEKLSQETSFYSFFLKSENHMLGFLIEIYHVSGLEKLSPIDKYIFKDVSGVIFIFDTNCKPIEKTIQSFQKLEKFTNKKKIPYLIQALSDNNKDSNKIIRTIRDHLGSSILKKRKDNVEVIYSISTSDYEKIMECLGNMLCIVEVNHNKIKYRKNHSVNSI